MRADWQTRTLSEVCQIKPPKKEAKELLSETDLVSFVPMNDLGIRQKELSLNEEKPLGKVVSSYTYFAENDVLLAKITPCFENGKLGIARGLKNGVGFGSSEYIVFRSNGKIDPEYLFYFLSQKSFRDNGAKVMTGAVGHKRVPKEFIEDHPIPLPSFDEQKRIVAILDEAFAGIDTAIANTGKNQENARELSGSYLSIALRQEGNQCAKHRLGSIVYRLTNGYVGPTRNIYKDDGVPYLLARHVKNNSLTFDGKTYVSEEFNKKNKKSILKTGDVLLVQSGHIGHSAVVTEEHAGHNCHAMIVITPMEMLLGEYLSLYFNSSQMKAHFQDIRSGSTVPHLTCKAVKEIEIPVPDMEEKKSIIRNYQGYAAEILRLEYIYQHKLESLNELKQSLLKKAFSGELTAKDDKLMDEVAVP